MIERIKQLIQSVFGKSERSRFRDKVLNEHIDFANVVSSSLLAKQMYDDLKVLVHPDRFQDSEIILKATEIFQLVHQNRGDYDKLLQLKERAYAELPLGKPATKE